MTTCLKCFEDFTKEAPAQKYCAACKLLHKEEERQVKKEYMERRERGCKIGQGAPKGKAHPNYKHGLYVAQTQSKEMYQEVRYCNRCNLDLHKVSRWHWVMHHIDHDHSNHQEDNLELLCKKCHAIKHKVESNFEGATTIPEGSTLK